MALTILISRKQPLVTIVQWFLDPGLHLDLACGPLLRLSFDQFRATGYGIIRRHFVEYKDRHVSDGHIEPLYPKQDERRFRRFLADQRPIEIGETPPGVLTVIPMEFQKNTLSWLRGLPEETRRKVPLDASLDVFWKAFDEALAATE